MVIATNRGSPKPGGRHRLRKTTFFMRQIMQSPGRVGAVAPSSLRLGRTMAAIAYRDDARRVLELGPGLGSITTALIEQGFEEEQLVLLEYSQAFCHQLVQSHPKALTLQGDAFEVENVLKEHNIDDVDVVVSGLPLLNFPCEKRISLLKQIINILPDDGIFVQFSYGLNSPLPLTEIEKLGVTSQVSKWVIRNIPPARVWTFRRSAKP